MKKFLGISLPFAALVFVALACNMDKIQKGLEEVTKPQVMTASDGSCEVTVPALWTKATDLNDRALIQTNYPLSEEYLIVTRQSKADFADDATLEDFVDAVRKDIPEQIDESVLTPPTSTKIGGYDAREFEVSGTVSKIKAKYFYAVVETPQNFYQVISWTLPSNYDKNKEELLTAIHSFKETSSGSAPVKTPAKKR
jgi:hypothetical protein